MSAVVRLIHLGPTLAVVALSAVLALIMAIQEGRPADARVLLIVLSVAGSQVFTGATNDWADRHRDAGRPGKPVAAGELRPGTALAIGGGGLGAQLVTSAALGWLPLALGAAASASALAYNLRLSRTPASVLPYLVSFGLLPAWIAAGVEIPVDRTAGASLLVMPFAAAAHLANTVRDFDLDAASGSRNLGQVLGQSTAMRLSIGLALAVGCGVALAFSVAERLSPPSLVLGAVGLAAVAQGTAGPRRLWIGLLVAAVCWTAAWTLATG